jgi:sugar phosphate isomerase/epimerase
MDPASSRRQFLRTTLSAAGVLSACSSSPTETATEAPPAPAVPANIGAQLYTLRNVIDADAAGILSKLAAIGYKEVEAVRGNFQGIAPAIATAGLRAVSMHVATPKRPSDWQTWGGPQEEPLSTGGDAWRAEVDAAKGAGLGYLVIPYIRPEDRGDLSFMKNFAVQLNQAGAIAAAAGIQLCYHNHAFEFESAGDTSGFQVLLDTLDPASARIELDVFWVSVAGYDPVELLAANPGKFPLVHLKDKTASLPVQFNEKVPPVAFKELGAGVIDFPTILRAGAESGVEHYFVEQDQCPGDPIDSLRASYEYLKVVHA